MDMSRYRDLFVAESLERLRQLGGHVLALERDSGDREHIDALFREAHSIKGMAGSMGYEAISELAHVMEGLMDRLRKGNMTFDGAMADLLLEGTDVLEHMVGAVAADAVFKVDISGLIGRFTDFASPDGAPVPGEKQPPSKPDGLEDGGPATGEPVLAVAASVRVSSELLDRLVNIAGELLTTRHRIAEAGRAAASPELALAVRDLERLARRLHSEALQARMLPFASVCERFPRMMRDLAKRSGKDILFAIEGRDIELDRGILEELPDPLVHILRNAVDHGIESPAERQAAGKPASSRITLAARRERDQTVVSVEDDGRGLSPDMLRAAVIGRGLLGVREAEALSDREALLLICLPGFSTAREVTDISGRGVGMDAVRAAVRGVGGSLVIESTPGQGTRMMLRLPLSVAIQPTLLLASGELVVALPVSSVRRTLELRPDQINEDGGRASCLVDDEEVPLYRLRSLLGQNGATGPAEYLPVLLVDHVGVTVALQVDRVIGHQDLYVRNPGRPLRAMRSLAGSAVLGDGRVVFLLDPDGLL